MGRGSMRGIFAPSDSPPCGARGERAGSIGARLLFGPGRRRARGAPRARAGFRAALRVGGKASYLSGTRLAAWPPREEGGVRVGRAAPARRPGSVYAGQPASRPRSEPEPAVLQSGFVGRGQPAGQGSAVSCHNVLLMLPCLSKTTYSDRCSGPSKSFRFGDCCAQP